MAYPVDASSLAAAEGAAASRGRADTGASLSADQYSASYLSADRSSVVSNGSLLDLYARSPASFPGSMDAPLQSESSSPAMANESTPMQPSVSASSNAGMSTPSTTRGFQTPNRDPSAAATGFSMPPSDSNASIWTTASASAPDSGPQSKRASMIGFDVDAMRSVQPTYDSNAFDHSTAVLQPQPQIGVQASQYDSDGSHYDEEEMPGAFFHASFNRSADGTFVAPAHQSNSTPAAEDSHGPEVEDAFSNALPSPPVPIRTSSVAQDSSTVSPSPSLTEGIATSLARHVHSRSNSSAQTVTDAIPLRHSSADFRDDSPSKATPLQPVDENASMGNDGGSNSSREPSLDEQKRLEKQLLDEADDSRPRTLKEARERARLRRQHGEAVSPPSTSQPVERTTSPRKGTSLHTRDVASSATAVDAGGPRNSIDLRDRPVRDPRRMSKRDHSLTSDRRSLSERSAPSDYSHDSDAEGAFTFDEPATQTAQRLSATTGANPQSTASMNDLTDAVDDAMNDLSFGDETLSAEDDFATPMPAPKPQEQARPHLPTSLPSSKSLASITGAVDGVRSSPLASPARYTPGTPKTSFFPSSTSNQSLATPPLGSPVRQRNAQAGHAPQRPTLVMPSRIDVYGKTLPMPKAFNSSGVIVDKKRKSSWERAGTYARYTNELLHLETGLSLWMQVVQRPAMRQQTSRPAKQSDDWLAHGALPRSMHVRNEGSYADSIRSDMTFPMRGDGAKAKEIVSVMPTMPESPVQGSVNLPYPGVVGQQQQPRSNSIASFGSMSALPSSTTTTDSLSTSRSAGLGGGNRFFGGLGRKGSKRTQPSASTSNIAASTALSSAAAAVGGSRAYLANNRSSRTASPGGAVSGSVASGRLSTDTFETTYSSHSRPESPATGAVRLTGLGLGEAASSPLASVPSASSGRLDTVREAKPSSSPLATAVTASSSSTTGLRAPMGPRAPMARSGSAQSHTAATTPVTPVTPITPITGGFGSGPTFVSRLGGGSFSSTAGQPRSPTRDVSFPDYLTAPPRRTSEMSIDPTSPPASSNSTYEPSASISPRLSSTTTTTPTPTTAAQNGPLRSSLSYSSVRDRIRRGSTHSDLEEEAGFQQALIKLGDVLPDADQTTLKFYLKKARGNDLAAIGDYLQDQSLGKLPRF